MTNVRLGRYRLRAGPTALCAAFAAVAIAQGCGGGGETTTGTTEGTTSTTSSSGTTTSNTSSTTSTSSSSGTGGMGTGGGGTGLTMAASIDASVAIDATPDPMGTTIYFTAFDAVAGAGVFTAPADGSAAATAVHAGAPFAAPFGIAVSSDGKQLFVADPGATDPGTGKDLGVIFALPTGGGTPIAISGTDATQARGLEIAVENNADIIYFTGQDKADGKVGVFKVAASGGMITPVLKGDPFRDPSGICVAADGSIYVADTVASASRTARIIQIKNGVATTIADDVHVGYPAGVALGQNETKLYVSALDPATLKDQILVIDIATKATSAITMGIDTFSESAGLHRAKKADIYAWADITAGAKGGKVFVFK